MELLVAILLILLVGFVIMGMFRKKRPTARPRQTGAATYGANDTNSWWLPFWLFGAGDSGDDHRHSHSADSPSHDSGGHFDSGGDGGGGGSDGGGDGGGE